MSIQPSLEKNPDMEQDTALIDDLPPDFKIEPFIKPFTPTVTSIMDETGEFLISYYGAQMALGFKGPLDFIRRCHNWVENTCVIGKGASLHWFYGEDGNMAYVCPQSKEDIRRGLILQFRAEIITNKEIPLLKSEYDEEIGLTIEYDEEKIEALAAQRADYFMENRIKHDYFLANDPKNIGHIYNYSPQSFSSSDE